MARSAGPWKLRKRSHSETWLVRFSYGGQQIERSTGESETGPARIRAAEIYAEVLSAPPPRLVRSRPSNELAPLVAAWLCMVEETRSAGWEATCRTYYRAHWSPRWSVLEDITSAEVQTYISDRLRHVTPTTVRKELSALRGMLRWCQRQGYLETVPTWQSPSGKSDYEPDVLTRDEVERVLAKLPTRDQHPKGYPVREYYTILWATGLRRGTLERLRWDDVDLDRASLLVRASADKRQNQRRVPLPAEAVMAFKALAPGVGRVFGRHEYRRVLFAALEAAGLGHRHITAHHSFRHARLSYLASRSDNIAAIQYLAGHRTLAATQRYVHSSEEQARTLLMEIGDLDDDDSRADSRAARFLGIKKGTSKGA